MQFWFKDIHNINFKNRGTYSKLSVIVYSDASDTAACACTIEVENMIVHRMWNSQEVLESSTWRELKAIELALVSFQNVFTGTNLNWHTDNQNCVRIVQSGSMKEKLQVIAMSIFSVCMQINFA